jgi:hypothetical protein
VNLPNQWNPGCWAAYNLPDPGPCSGRLVKAHLIPKQLLKREHVPDVWDPRVTVPMCGGPTGVGGHHGRLDSSRTLRIPRDALPWVVEAFAAEHGLLWWLEREYGVTEEAA